jgi:hypothetical protein
MVIRKSKVSHCCWDNPTSELCFADVRSMTLAFLRMVRNVSKEASSVEIM